MERHQDYNDSKHREWCDEHNIGITHFGVNPDKLQIELLRYDEFHLRSAMTRKLLSYFRDVIDVYDYETLQNFFSYFDNLWGKYFSSQSILNKPLTRLQGKHCVSFIMDIDNFIEMITTSLQPFPELSAYIQALKLWKK